MTPAEHLVNTARRLAERGLSPGGSGNISVRDGDRILITPTGSAFSRLTAESLSVLDGSGTHIDGPKPSKEWPFHLAAYDVRPEAQAIVHLHSPYATALSCLEPDPEFHTMPLVVPYQRMKLGNPIALAAYAAPGTDALAENIRETVKDHPVLLMASHGSLACAASLDSAADLAEELESTAMVWFLAQGTQRQLRNIES